MLKILFQTFSPLTIISLMITLMLIFDHTTAGPMIQTSSSSSSPNLALSSNDGELMKNSNYRLSALMQPSLNDDSFSNSIKDRLLMVQPMLQHGIPFYTNRKRSCLINAGLSNNCDFRDFISAANARRIWESQASPGKRSSSSIKQQQIPVWMFMNPSTITSIDGGLQSQEQQFSDGIKRPISSGWNERLAKRIECFSGLPGGDCENSFLGGESWGQDFLRPGGRNPGRR